MISFGFTGCHKTRGWLRIGVWGLALILAWPIQSTALAGPVDWFKHDFEQALAICNDPGLQGPAQSEQQKQQLWRLVDGAFQGEVIIPGILRKTWPVLTEAEKERLWPAVNYAIKWKMIGKLFAFHLEEVDFTAEGAGDDGYILEGFLGTRLLRHPARFVFVDQKGRWAASDIVVDGFSLMDHYCRKFDGTYFTGGLDGLLRHLAAEVNDDFQEMGYTPPGGPIANLEMEPK